MANPTELHFATAKIVIHYLKGTIDYGIWYKRGAEIEIRGYNDSDYAGEREVKLGLML